MNWEKLKLPTYFLLLLLAFGPLIYMGSGSRYEHQVETAVHEYVVRVAQDGGRQPENVLVGNPTFLFPVANKSPRHIISRFGDARGGREHQGIDIKADQGTPVLAIAKGTVERVKNGGNGGKQVWLRLRDSTMVFYAHLDEQWVEAGEEVNAGQAIGSVGNTGNARHTTPHLHFEIILPGKGEVNPAQFYEGA
jgi:murein DD-endopeptidase MepM/ murein hydrolase activator NlpD